MWEGSGGDFIISELMCCEKTLEISCNKVRKSLKI